MKKILLVVAMTFIVSTNLHASLTDGLVSYYSFNGSANDASGNNHHGTVDGATLTTDRFGNLNNAYSFDGVDDYIRILDNPALDGMDALTLSVWVKLNGDDREMEVLNKIVHYNGSQNNSYNIGIDGWGPLAVFQYATEDAYSIKISNETLTNESWHHIVGVYTGMEGSLFIDGSLAALSRNDPDSPGPINDIAADLLIGCGEQNGGLIKFFSGEIDDVSIYNRALNHEEVTELYNVPEPCTIILLGIGSLALRRKRKS